MNATRIVHATSEARFSVRVSRGEGVHPGETEVKGGERTSAESQFFACDNREGRMDVRLLPRSKSGLPHTVSQRFKSVAVAIAWLELGLMASLGLPTELTAAETAQDDPVAGMEFVRVPAGDFLMGSTSSEAFESEQPVTQVRISNAFDLGKYEVTQAQWHLVMGTNPSYFSGCASCPVESVSWHDVQEFIGTLNAREGTARYRLPTEAEWEYAARAGTTGDRYSEDLDMIAWYAKNSGGRTHPVGEKAPTRFGLHDMLGNVWEWVQDWHGAYPGGIVTDYRGPRNGWERLIRGGAWRYDSRRCRSPGRSDGQPGVPPGYRGITVGFRLLRNVQ